MINQDLVNTCFSYMVGWALKSCGKGHWRHGRHRDIQLASVARTHVRDVILDLRWTLETVLLKCISRASRLSVDPVSLSQHRTLLPVVIRMLLKLMKKGQKITQTFNHWPLPDF